MIWFHLTLQTFNTPPKDSGMLSFFLWNTGSVSRATAWFPPGGDVSYRPWRRAQHGRCHGSHRWPGSAVRRLFGRSAGSGVGTPEATTTMAGRESCSVFRKKMKVNIDQSCLFCSIWTMKQLFLGYAWYQSVPKAFSNRSWPPTKGRTTWCLVDSFTLHQSQEPSIKAIQYPDLWDVLCMVTCIKVAWKFCEFQWWVLVGDSPLRRMGDSLMIPLTLQRNIWQSIMSSVFPRRLSFCGLSLSTFGGLLGRKWLKCNFFAKRHVFRPKETANNIAVLRNLWKTIHTFSVHQGVYRYIISLLSSQRIARIPSLAIQSNLLQLKSHHREYI